MTARILKLPCLHHVRLQHLDGREWCKESFLDVAQAWAWVAEQVSQQAECRPEDVDAFEGELGDMVCVDGIPVCWVVHGLPLQ